MERVAGKKKKKKKKRGGGFLCASLCGKLGGKGHATRRGYRSWTEIRRRKKGKGRKDPSNERDSWGERKEHPFCGKEKSKSFSTSGEEERTKTGEEGGYTIVISLRRTRIEGEGVIFPLI